MPCAVHLQGHRAELDGVDGLVGQAGVEEPAVDLEAPAADAARAQARVRVRAVHLQALIKGGGVGAWAGGVC
jgi:hypothetical protein